MVEMGKIDLSLTAIATNTDQHFESCSAWLFLPRLFLLVLGRDLFQADGHLCNYSGGLFLSLLSILLVLGGGFLWS